MQAYEAPLKGSPASGLGCMSTTPEGVGTTSAMLGTYPDSLAPASTLHFPTSWTAQGVTGDSLTLPGSLGSLVPEVLARPQGCHLRRTPPIARQRSRRRSQFKKKDQALSSAPANCYPAAAA
jgi:hypothetical protein